MALPYHRGHLNQSEMTQRGAGYGFGSRDQRSEEASRTLMEQENDRRWVSSQVIRQSLHYIYNLFHLIVITPNPNESGRIRRASQCTKVGK